MKKKIIFFLLVVDILVLPVIAETNEKKLEGTVLTKTLEDGTVIEYQKLNSQEITRLRRVVSNCMIFNLPDDKLQSIADDIGLTLKELRAAIGNDELQNYGISADIDHTSVVQVANNKIFMNNLDLMCNVEYLEDKGDLDISVLLTDKLFNNFKPLTRTTFNLTKMIFDASGNFDKDPNSTFIILPLKYNVREFITEPKYFIEKYPIIYHGIFYYYNDCVMLDLNSYAKVNLD